MTTTTTLAHHAEHAYLLFPEDPENLVRAMVRLHALQTLYRIHPCTSSADDVKIATTIRREVDVFSRTTLVGIATAVCPTPDFCSLLRKADR
ncbi:hypothetical protein [Streptomyces sp. NPDC088727]|uniref:hypothetical protein n=1 Tax=Streptomyces sp. NPDC088727 TaxID=3365875 RepID=UPI0037F7667F